MEPLHDQTNPTKPETIVCPANRIIQLRAISPGGRNVAPEPDLLCKLCIAHGLYEPETNTSHEAT